MRDRFLDTQRILDSKSVGIEDKSELWIRSFNLKSKEELADLISSDTISRVSKNNDEVWNIVNNFVYLNNNRDYKDILSYFDDFNDMNASSRIVNYMEQYEV